MKNKPANIINHIGLVLDASSSMTNVAQSLIQVADAQISYLAQRSKELDQETRISVWTFSYAHDINCVVWDMDVLRLPSIANYYKPYGNTALIDATVKTIDDLKEIPERYGDHSFLVYVLTDAQENGSEKDTPITLKKCIENLPDNWTLAALVPDNTAKHEAKRFGFSLVNIEIWDATSKLGVEEVGKRIRVTTDNYMISRAAGIRSTAGLFSTDAQTVNKNTIKQAGLKPLAASKYKLVPVPYDVEIRQFTVECGFQYIIGQGFYELNKTETIQPQKVIAIVERGPRGKVYVGADARNMLNLPDAEVRVRPDFNAEYAVYVQSTSVNRKLKVGTKYLYLTP
jgi:hypothetical protein